MHNLYSAHIPFQTCKCNFKSCIKCTVARELLPIVLKKTQSKDVTWGNVESVRDQSDAFTGTSTLSVCTERIWSKQREIINNTAATNVGWRGPSCAELHAFTNIVCLYLNYRSELESFYTAKILDQAWRVPPLLCSTEIAFYGKY